MMKRLLKTMSILLGGISVGAGVMAFFIGYQVQQTMAWIHYIRTLELITDARLIHAGQTAELLQMKDKAITQSVLTLAKEYSNYYSQNEKNTCLWLVQQYYQNNPELITPAEIKTLLDALPPQLPASCELKTSFQDATTQTAPLPTLSPSTQTNN